MTPYYADEQVTLYHGDALDVLSKLPDESVNCCVTSPPYFGLRDYGEEGQYGTEESPIAYVQTMRAVFAEVRRVLSSDGTLWLNLGDTYYSGRGAATGVDEKNPARRFGARSVDRGGADWAKPKDLLGIPWRVAFALQDEGWTLRSEVIWDKINATPDPARDRPPANHEKVFLLAKSRRYWFDRESLVSGIGEDLDSVWTLAAQPFPAAHFAVMPRLIAERAILAGCKPGGTVLDPFSGSGTTGMAAAKHGRSYVGIDLSADYLDLSLRTRLAQPGLNFGGVA